MDVRSVTLRPRVRLPLVAVRLLCVLTLLLTSVTVSWTTVVAAAVLLCSYRWSATGVSCSGGFNAKSNPLRGRASSKSLASLPAPAAERLRDDLLDAFAAGVEASATLEAFEPIRLGSRCLFARDARLWSGADWHSGLCASANAAASAGRLRLFCAASGHLPLDGFLLQLPSPHCDDYRRFAVAVYATLRSIAACDEGADCMADEARLDRHGWVFAFAGVTFFVTTFAPFYPRRHSRYAYGAACGFVLLQPELSFARRDLPPDTPRTNWDPADPAQTVRDRIRCSFAAAGQRYRIRDTVSYPMIHDIVQPPEQQQEQQEQQQQQEQEQQQQEQELWWKLAQQQQQSHEL